MSAPMRPGDVPHSAALGLVAYRYSHHVLTLVKHRYGVQATRNVAEHAVAALAYGAALTERVEGDRWSIAAGALAAGAGLERTADAMGLDVWDLRVLLGQWASQQHRLGLIGADRYGQVMSLIREDPS
ncbi:MAG: hypothetical protein M3R09_11195 [Actinomycetota bacterium]|nr:hypothetical protein [Actinomycetota bacterium]